MGFPYFAVIGALHAWHTQSKCVLLTHRRTVFHDDLLFLCFTIQVPLVSFILFLPVMTADVILFNYRNASVTHQKKPVYSLSGSVCCLVIHLKSCLCRQFSVAVMQWFSFLLHHWCDVIYSCPVHSYVQEIQLYECDSMDVSWCPVSAGRTKWGRVQQVANFVVHHYQSSVMMYILFMACVLLTLRVWYWHQ